MMDILIGLVAVAAIGFVVWLSKHKQTPSVPAAKEYAAAVAGGFEDRFAELKVTVAEEVSRVPALISGEVQRLTAELDAALQRAQKAEADYAAAQAAHQAQLAAVATRVTAAIQSSPELP